jgi:hypothetical protein
VTTIISYHEKVFAKARKIILQKKILQEIEQTVMKNYSFNPSKSNNVKVASLHAVALFSIHMFGIPFPVNVADFQKSRPGGQFSTSKKIKASCVNPLFTVYKVLYTLHLKASTQVLP